MPIKEEILRECQRFTLPPKFTLFIHEKKIYGLRTSDCADTAQTVYRAGSEKFMEIFEEYMPAWAYYYPEIFKNVFSKSDSIDYSIDETAVKGLRTILKEEDKLLAIGELPYDVKNWICETLDTINNS